MRVTCCVDGNAGDSQEYGGETPENAARIFVEEWRDDIIDETNVIVEALDDEARALLGWHSDEGSSHFKMFRVTPIVRWECEEVQSFDEVSP